MNEMTMSRVVESLLNSLRISYISYTSNIYSTKRNYRFFLVLQNDLVDIDPSMTISKQSLLTKLSSDCEILEVRCDRLAKIDKDDLPSGYFKATNGSSDPGSQERAWSMKLYKDSGGLYAYVLESGSQAILFKVLSSMQSSTKNFDMSSRQLVSYERDFIAENVSQLGSSDYAGSRVVRMDVKVLNSLGYVLGIIKDHYYYDTTDDTSNRFYHEYNFPSTASAMQAIMNGESTDSKISGTYVSIQGGTPSRMIIETKDSPWKFMIKDLS
jgi:hypothetical protein